MKKENFKCFKDPIVHTWFDCLQSAREVVFGRVVNKEAREYEPIKADCILLLHVFPIAFSGGQRRRMGCIDGLGHFACHSMTRQQDKGCEE
jgi:hypothetical protein